MSVRPLTWLGERSYGFYLWHLPVLFLLAAVLPPLGKIPGLLIAFTVALVMTALSWHLVERPFLRLKHRFTRTGVAPAADSAIAR
jgi:peptidoglycan/LPS O-acetylase OafA/YrhL